jgi:hypothetical protein
MDLLQLVNHRLTNDSGSADYAAAMANTPRTVAGWRGAASARATYGLILVMSLLAIWTSEEHPSGKEVLLSVGATSVVFWIAHVYSEIVALRIREGHDLTGKERREAAVNELPLIEVAIPPMVLIALATAGAMSVTLAIDISLWICLAGLGALGWYSAHSAGARGFRLVLASTTSLALGVVIVLLKTQID